MASAGYSGTPLPQKLGITRLTKDVELLHAFVTKKGRLEEVLDRARAGLDSEAIVWVSWPKKAAGVASEVTEDTVRDMALPLGFVDVKVCAVDETWSGLKLVVRKTLR